MVVLVLGHRGMLGSVVVRYLQQQGEEVVTTDLRWPDPRIIEVAAGADHVIDCIRGDAERPIVLGYRCRLILPSTDAWREDTPYARAKRAAEMARAAVIRSGIVDIGRQPEPAFTDWLCDPLTPLEWIRAAWALRDAPPAVYPVGRHVVDRWTLAMHVARVFGGPWPTPAQGGRLDRVVIGMGGTWIGDALDEYRAWLS
jgi:hypothetical protein